MTSMESAGRYGVKQYWSKFLGSRIGIIPTPVFLVILALVTGFLSAEKMPSDILMNIALLAVGGFACAQLGNWIPYINQIGAAAIFATFIPSYLVYAHVLPEPVITSITTFTKSSNFLYLFISSIIVGSILGMNRKVLIAGFVKIFIPLALGSVAAGTVGMAVGIALGLDPWHTLFFVIVPIMGGGVGEGAIPLAVGYAHLQGGETGTLLGQILPAVMFGSLTAILFSGALNRLGKSYPELTGEGRLAKIDNVDVASLTDAPTIKPDTATIAAAMVLIVALYLAGALAQTALHWPGPVVMLFLTVALKLGSVVSPVLERGAHAIYQFFRIGVTYPLLFAIGVAMTPWSELVAALHFANVITIVATVTTMMGTGFTVARFIDMYPIDVAIVNACHSGQGGTGDVAILTASNRMQLMPFAQIATRIGGAITVTIALIAFAHFS